MGQIEVPERQGIYLFLLPNLKCGYVGSSNNLKRRYEQHVSGIGNKTIERYLKHNSNIEYMILEFCDGYKTKDLKIIEENWINHFRKKGLNLINISKPTEEPSYKESKVVLAYDIHTLSFVGEWNSLCCAASEIKGNKSGISQAILETSRGHSGTNRLTYKGLFWFFKNNFSKEKLLLKKQKYDDALINKKIKTRSSGIANSKKVKQYSKEGVFIKIWSSGIQVSRETNISQQSISHNLTGKSRSAGGFIWKYAEESESNNESLCFQNF